MANNMNKKKYIIAIISIAVVAVGIIVYYNHYNGGLIKKSTFAKIMADIYLVDAMAQNKGNLYNTNNPDRYMENSYHTLLTKYSTTKADFDSTLAWYTSHPEEYSSLYDEVVGILSEKEGRMNLIIAKRDSITKRINTLRDSLTVRYWNYPKTVRLPLTEKDTIPKDLVFTFPTDSILHGKLFFNIDYVFPRRNKATDTASVELVVCYNDTIADTTTIKLERTFTMKPMKMVAAVRDTLPAVKVEAHLLKSKQLKQTTATISNIDLYYMKYEITDSVEFDEIQLPPIFTY